MAVIIDRNANNEIIENLEKLNIMYYKSASLDFLYAPVNTHPDMQIHFTDNNTAIVCPSLYQYFKNILPDRITLIKGAKDPDGSYPGDCLYNVATIGNKLIGNLSYVDDVIKEYYKNKSFEFINVRQGYTKCNLCIVDSNSVITEDQGLYDTLKKHGINVFKLPAGNVGMKNFEYGFIGGASGFIEEGVLAFCGNLPDETFSEMKMFIKSRGVDIIQLSETRLSDFGSILYFN